MNAFIIKWIIFNLTTKIVVIFNDRSSIIDLYTLFKCILRMWTKRGNWNKIFGEQKILGWSKINLHSPKMRVLGWNYRLTC